jgi:pilus assembly protein CpaB
MARVGELAMAGGNRKLLLLALGAGLVAAIIVFAAVQSNSGGSSSSSSSGPVTGAVVAARAIAAGSTIAAGDLKVTDVPNSLLILGAYTDTSAAVGQAARVAIAQGEQITPDKVGSPVKSANGLNSVLPPGMRAIAVGVEQVTAVGGNLLPGDRVDVIGVFNGGGQTNNSAETVSTILQNVEILAVAQEAQTPVAAPASGGTAQTSTSGQIPSGAKTKPDATTVTLAVDPQQAELLAGVQQTAGKIYLTLRSFGDQGTTAVPPVNVNANGGQ